MGEKHNSDLKATTLQRTKLFLIYFLVAFGAGKKQF